MNADSINNKTSLIHLDGIETYKVYESAEKPGHNQWPASFLNSSGKLCVVFQNIQGDLTEKPSYDYRQKPGKYRKSLICMQWQEQRRCFDKLWETPLNRATPFCIMSPNPTPAGKNLGVCRAEAFPEYKVDSPDDILVLSTENDGQSFTLLTRITVENRCLWPNDLRCIGQKVYLTLYDGAGGVYLSESFDAGHTWTAPYKFAWARDNMSFHEPTLATLLDGSLMVVMRTHRMDIPVQNGINYHAIKLFPDGVGRWKVSDIRDTGFGFRGRPYLLRTVAGILILACPGHFMAFSLNEGRTWESGLYDFKIPTVILNQSGEKRPYNHNADTMLLELPDGRFYYSYFIGSDFPFPAPCDEYIGGTFFTLQTF